MIQRGIIGLRLWLSLKGAGCPICRVRTQSEARYAFDLLWENVNDPGTRQRLLQSQGFCHKHIQLVLETSKKEVGSSLGISIIYEHLIRYFLDRLSQLPTPKPRKRFRRLLNANRRLSEAEEQLQPPGQCPICIAGDEAADRQIGFLVEDGLQLAEWQKAWADSDGLCREHLTKALALAWEQNEVTFEFLRADADRRLRALQRNLAEHIRKHDWQYREEPISPEERSALSKVLLFFGGAQEPYDY